MIIYISRLFSLWQPPFSPQMHCGLSIPELFLCYFVFSICCGNHLYDMFFTCDILPSHILWIMYPSAMGCLYHVYFFAASRFADLLWIVDTWHLCRCDISSSLSAMPHVLSWYISIELFICYFCGLSIQYHAQVVETCDFPHPLWITDNLPHQYRFYLLIYVYVQVNRIYFTHREILIEQARRLRCRAACVPERGGGGCFGFFLLFSPDAVRWDTCTCMAGYVVNFFIGDWSPARAILQCTWLTRCKVSAERITYIPWIPGKNLSTVRQRSAFSVRHPDLTSGVCCG